MYKRQFSDSKFENNIEIDYVSHAKSMGAEAIQVSDITELEREVKSAISKKGVNVIVIDTDPNISTEEGGAWWDVAIPEVSKNQNVKKAFEDYSIFRKKK